MAHFYHWHQISTSVKWRFFFSFTSNLLYLHSSSIFHFICKLIHRLNKTSKHHNDEILQYENVLPFSVYKMPYCMTLALWLCNFPIQNIWNLNKNDNTKFSRTNPMICVINTSYILKFNNHQQ